MKGAVLIVGVAGTAWTVERAIGYATAKNNTITEALMKERHGKTSKNPKPKAGKGENQVPSILATGGGDFQLDLEWPPKCPENETECKQIVCDLVQTFLQETLCTGQNDDCKVVVPCYEVTQAIRKLDAPKTNLLHRALVATTFSFAVTLIIECVAGDCSDAAANTAAGVAAMGPIETTFGTITDDGMIAGIKAAILALDPPPAPDTADYFKALTLYYDSRTSSFKVGSVYDAPPAVSGFELVGPGFCKDSVGNRYGFLYTPNSLGNLSLEQCFPACLEYAGSTCWTAPPPFIGIEYEPSSYSSDCVCLFEVISGKPTDLLDLSSCTDPPAAVTSSGSRPGVGPVFTSSVGSYTCYKYIG